jgi:hypothetical protein
MRIRSEYSSRLAYGKLQDVHNRVLQLDWPAAPISDRLSTFGFAIWQELCDEVKIKPVFGVELGVSAQLGQKRPAISYMTFFAIEKLRAINELVFKATSKSGQYWSLTYEEALNATGVLKITDHRVSLGNLREDEFLYISLSPSTPIGLFREAKEKGFKFIATSDNVFPYMEDKLIYHTLFYRDAETAPYPQYILTDEEWRESLPYCVTDEDAELAIANRNYAMVTCNAKLLKADVFKPNDIY